MEPEKVRLRAQLSLIFDSILIIASFFLTYWIRNLITEAPFLPLEPLDYYLWILFVSLPGWWLLLFFSDAYETRLFSTRAVVFFFLKAGIQVLFALSLIFFLFQKVQFNRTFVIPYVALTTFSMMSWRILVARFHLAKPRKVLVVGGGEPLDHFLNGTSEEGLRGMELIGLLANKGESLENKGVPLLGLPEDLYRVLHEQVVDMVVFAFTPSKREENQQLLNICQMLGTDTILMMEHHTSMKQVDVGRFAGRPFIYLRHQPSGNVALWTKSALDRVLALLTLMVLTPVLLIVTALIKMTSRGPLLFVQERMGLNGRKFPMYKFRTMVQNAEANKDSLRSQNEMSGPVFKIQKDPRITPVGRFLRRFSLDELPQLVNVLKGEMSLVGPRPLPIKEAEQITGAQRRRLSVRPGITCTWQVSGRNHLTYEEWMTLDLEYIDNWSLSLDMKILLKTPSAVISGKGAF